MSERPETIVIGENTYTVLYPEMVRPLTPQERQKLKNSIEQYGITQEVIVDQANGIIDGANRARIAHDLGCPTIPTRIVECKNEEEKRELAMSLNIDRRHLTPEERQKLIEPRRERVRQARAGGDSLRSIAEKEGISESQVRKDLRSASSAHQCAPETTPSEPSANGSDSTSDTPVSPGATPAAPRETVAPAKVKGRDGKLHPSTRTPGKRGKCNAPPPLPARVIKKLVKPIQTLVAQGQVKAYEAEEFALALDKKAQTSLVEGKDEAAIAATVRKWCVEQNVVRRAQRLPKEITSILSHKWHDGDEWGIDKATPEARKTILAELLRAREELDNQIDRVQALAP